LTLKVPDSFKTVVLVPALLAASVGANAGGTLRCVSLEYPPLVFTDKDGKTQGIALDVVTQALKSDDWKVELEVLPWARALKLMKAGERDCIFTIFKTPEREEFLDFSRRPLLLQPIGLYARKNSGIQFDGDLSKLKDKSFAAVFAVSYGNKFETDKAVLKVNTAYTANEAFLLLGRGRVDLAISNVYLAAYELGKAETANLADIVQLQPPVETVTSYIAFAKGKHEAARAAFDGAIDEVLKSNNGQQFKKILDHHKIPQAMRASLLK
jgi:polar amino acid transport system substrate-binding protein